MKNSDIKTNDLYDEQYIADINKEEYDLKTAQGYEEQHSHRFSTENIDRIDNILKVIYENTEGEKCLDVGVGSGLVLLRESQLFSECIGMDLSLKMALEKGIPKSKLVMGDCYHLPFDSEEFDLVSAYSVLHHLTNVKKFYAEAYRVLKKGGYLYSDGDINIHCIRLLRKFKMIQIRFAGKKYRWNYKYWRDRLKHRDIDEYHHMGLDFRESKRLLKQIGFEKVIFTPRFSVNPDHTRKLTFRMMKRFHHLFKLKSCFTHIQFLAIK